MRRRSESSLTLWGEKKQVETDHTEIEHLREKVKELQDLKNVLEHNIRATLAELQNIESALRRSMPVHPDYIKDLREELEADSFA